MFGAVTRLPKSPPPGSRGDFKADLIFVLAGRESRKLYGLDLYRYGCAPKLLLSVGRFEVRRFVELPLPQRVDLRPIAAPVYPPLRHFFVCFGGARVQIDQIPVHRWGTLTETEALGTWLEQRQDIRRVLVVSSRSHLLRVQMCCRALLPRRIELGFLAVPQGFVSPGGSRGVNAEDSFRQRVAELVKLVLYYAVFSIRSLVRQDAK